MSDEKKNIIKQEEEKVKKAQKAYKERYPYIVAIGGAFGLVCTFYGFEKLIDQTELFSENPWILLGAGLTLLAITGSFYNKL